MSIALYKSRCKLQEGISWHYASAQILVRTLNLCLREFGEAGDSEEELADPIQEGEAIVFLFRDWTFLLLFPFYNPNTINLHVLMVLSIGWIINAILLPEVVISVLCLTVQCFKSKSMQGWSVFLSSLSSIFILSGSFPILSKKVSTMDNLFPLK